MHYIQMSPLADMRIVASTASTLEEPRRKNTLKIDFPLCLTLRLFEEPRGTILNSAVGWNSKIGRVWQKMMRDFDRMFLNLDDLGNVPQYPDYPVYQLFATLVKPSKSKTLPQLMAENWIYIQSFCKGRLVAFPILSFSCFIFLFIGLKPINISQPKQINVFSR